MKWIFSYIFLLVLCLSCSSTKDSAAATDTFEQDLKKAEQIEKNKRSIDLTQRIKTFPGVKVEGSGGSAIFTIRNSRSFDLGDGQPLFVLDGLMMTSYEQLYSTVDVSEIKKIEVLRKVSETQEYGFRGNYGVIRITTDQ